jgi:hypothetical protein
MRGCVGVGVSVGAGVGVGLGLVVGGCGWVGGVAVCIEVEGNLWCN